MEIILLASIEFTANISFGTMESIGVLLSPECSLSSKIASLFGLLSTVEGTEKEDCHFCLENINPNVQRFIIKTPCCGHLVQTKCFQMWTMTSADIEDEMARCAYCRMVYRDTRFCFLCLKIKDGEQFMATRCCHSTVHTSCAQELRVLLTCIDGDVTLECGKATWCLLASAIKRRKEPTHNRQFPL
jgi:hypothetical protein